jgi:RNA ligase
MNLKEIYNWYVKAGYLKGIERDGLTLYNYTTQCVMKGNWNYHTRCARGLILDEEGKYIARPFQKFFGLYEKEETYLQNIPDEMAEIAIKYDGSMVVVFENPNRVGGDRGGWDAVTRGCWDNDQTRFTKRWLLKNQERLESGYTYCFELTAPWNQIVIPYEEEKMTLLGRVDQYGLESTYAETAEYGKEHDLEAIEFFEGKVGDIDLVHIPYELEGYVARFPNGLRVKLKAPHYEERHKKMT